MKQIRTCSVPGCQKQKSKNISLHYLPQNIIERTIWQNSLKLRRDNGNTSQLVCSRHFYPTDFFSFGMHLYFY